MTPGFFDTHSHFHDPAWPGGLVWPKPDAPFYRTCLPANYVEEVGPNPVVVVETSPRAQDDERLATFAASERLIRCYINNLRPLEEGFSNRLKLSAAAPKWRGIRLRPIRQYDMSDRNLIDALAQLDGLGHVELGIETPDRLGELCQLCCDLPKIKFVLAHAGHPDLEQERTVFDYGKLANIHNLFVKLSPPKRLPFGDDVIRTRLARHFGLLMQLLPPSRFVLGSNWPVYLNMDEFLAWVCDEYGMFADPKMLLWSNARKLYRDPSASVMDI